ncbi:AAA family ATPase [Chromohalobacter moromii]|uniref:ATP-binding protein n=1 Tax=Chromohalobacter moromii TaxID=2860329 RepID=A0A9X2WZU6_9GAMM|nr:AAA family ATPase [Chromohalobacter moromii]MCK2044824.1 ATP-binding protein [Chromohalobacter moromii]MCT8504023.1 ATP-binding protein [Chromohalobacter moromii]
MSSLRALRARNLRSFHSGSEYVDINDVNVLVGKNSCGKSTFARLFPLLRQSIEENTKGPILWFGDYVDFGDFSSSLNSKAEPGNEEIFFDFDLDLNVVVDRHNQALPEFPPEFDVSVIGGRSVDFRARVSLGVKEEYQKTVTSYVSISIDGIDIEIEFGDSEVKKFSAKIDSLGKFVEFGGNYMSVDSDFLPRLYVPLKKARSPGHSFSDKPSTFEEIKKRFAEFVRSYHHQNKSIHNVMCAIQTLRMSDEKGVFEHLRKEFKGDKKFRKFVEEDKKVFSKISFMYFLSMNINALMVSVNKVVRDFSSSVRYLGPIRSTAERFYRYQDLQVKEVDHSGSNLSMVINSLSDAKKSSLRTWMNTHFGFGLELKSEGYHYALSIKEDGSDIAYNISDMGFGYSQILPIVVSIWLEAEKEEGLDFWGRVEESVIVIEQPELHLHPELQKRFAYAISKIVSMNNKKRIRFVLETHSKHMIDAFGEAIRSNVVSDEKINIVIFEKLFDGFTKTSASGFDDEGYLMNWPVGFLSA